MKIEFRPATEQNRAELLELRIKPEQSTFIETVAECLQEAEEFSLWRPVGIYDEALLIGFAMYGLWKNEGSDGRVWLDRFLIDQKWQGMGYAKPVLDALLNRIFKTYACKEIYLSLYLENKRALKIYQNQGFLLNGELDINGEKVMVLAREYHQKKASV